MRSWVWLGLVGVLLSAACGGLPPEPITLQGNLLTLDNRTTSAWSDVEIWVNYYYRVTTATIPAGGRFQAPLDAFTEGRGTRFNFARAQIRDVRVKAKLPDGTPVEITKQFERTGLERLGERR